MIPKNVIAQWLSINTIVIFPMHLVFFNIFTGTGVILFGLDHDFKNSLAFSILYIVGAGIEFQQAVDGLGLPAGGLYYPMLCSMDGRKRKTFTRRCPCSNTAAVNASKLTIHR